MRVLVTRPDPDGALTADRLTAMGHQPVLMPLFASRVVAAVSDLPAAAETGCFIATSARALSLFDSLDTEGDGFLDLPIHVVGPATARAARAAGFADVREGAGTAADLAAALVRERGGAADRPLQSGAIVYLAGEPRKPLIEAALSAAKLPFQVVVCYEMQEISYSTDTEISDLLSPPLDAVLLYSANTARRFSELVESKGLGKSLESARFLCLSTSIADALPESWRARAVAAAHPDEDSLLASLAALG